jgi:hypothetical protein
MIVGGGTEDRRQSVQTYDWKGTASVGERKVAGGFVADSGDERAINGLRS